MKTKTKHKKSSAWRRKANSSPIAKGRKAKRKGRNPGKMKHIGGRGLWLIAADSKILIGFKAEQSPLFLLF